MSDDGYRWGSGANGMRDKQRDAALAATVKELLDDRGWGPADVERELRRLGRTGGSYERFHSALKGQRGMTPETLALFAQALRTTPAAIRYIAGIMSPAEEARFRRRQRTEEAILLDGALDGESRAQLIAMYKLLVTVPPRSDSGSDDVKRSL